MQQYLLIKQSRFYFSFTSTKKTNRLIVESQFLAAQILVGLDAEEEGKDDEDGEGKAVDQTHPQPNAHPEFEPSGHLRTKWIKLLDRVIH